MKKNVPPGKDTDRMVYSARSGYVWVVGFSGRADSICVMAVPNVSDGLDKRRTDTHRGFRGSIISTRWTRIFAHHILEHAVGGRGSDIRPRRGRDRAGSGKIVRTIRRELEQEQRNLVGEVGEVPQGRVLRTFGFKYVSEGRKRQSLRIGGGSERRGARELRVDITKERQSCSNTVGVKNF
ncbi:hypothetical protein C8R44DRAFT_741692 [Mycena epipterygia]|nr:hypothetical protein C8R44DRAFT_741692 [Mycena epipterygia]